MTKEEFYALYEEIATKRKLMLPKYVEILGRYFPIDVKDPKELYISKYMNETGLDREFAEDMWQYASRPVEDIRNPINSYTVMDRFSVYLHEDKLGMAKKDKEFVDNFITLLKGYGTMNYAIESNNASSYYDSKVLEFDHEDVVITDPCYLMPKDNSCAWSDCEYGHTLEAFGVNRYLTRDTLYGDWSCTVYNLDKKEELIGEFCADAGLVCVIGLNDVVDRINPDFEQWAKEHEWCVTIVKDFTGVVQVRTGFSNQYSEFYCYVRGSGSPNFVSRQTGLSITHHP